jgi:hypothetical protein
MSKFEKLKEKLMSQGKSEKQAGGIAYSAGVKKFGAKKMHKAAALGKPAAKVKV